MKKQEFKPRSMPLWYTITMIATVAIGLSSSIWLQGYSWLSFLVPLYFCVQWLGARITMDKGMLYLQGTLIREQKVRIDLIRKIKVQRTKRLQVIHSRGFTMFDPEDGEALIQALKKENPAIEVER